MRTDRGFRRGRRPRSQRARTRPTGDARRAGQGTGVFAGAGTDESMSRSVAHYACLEREWPSRVLDLTHTRSSVPSAALSVSTIIR